MAVLWPTHSKIFPHHIKIYNCIGICFYQFGDRDIGLLIWAKLADREPKLQGETSFDFSGCCCCCCCCHLWTYCQVPLCCQICIIPSVIVYFTYLDYNISILSVILQQLYVRYINDCSIKTQAMPCSTPVIPIRCQFFFSYGVEIAETGCFILPSQAKLRLTKALEGIMRASAPQLSNKQ